MSVQVETVTDGDTLQLSNGQKVRLCSIDAPEKISPWDRNLRRIFSGWWMLRVGW